MSRGSTGDRRRGTRTRAGRRAAAVLAGALSIVILAACGSSGPAEHAARTHPTPVCTSHARAEMARSVGVQATTIAASRSIGNDGMPQCTFKVRLPRAGQVTVIANVDVEPSAYFVLERTIVEASQVFGPRRLSPAPVAVPGLGLEASWFPEEDWLQATDGVRLVTTSIDWNGAKQGREIALARAVTRTYLKTPHGKAAQALATGYPSG
jgi:hypothetical protein